MTAILKIAAGKLGNFSGNGPFDTIHHHENFQSSWRTRSGGKDGFVEHQNGSSVDIKNGLELKVLYVDSIYTHQQYLKIFDMNKL